MKMTNWFKAYKQRRNSILVQNVVSEANDKIFIADKEINGSPAIALMVEGVVIDYTYGESTKASYDPDGIKLNAETDTLRLLNRMATLRNIEIENQIKEKGLAL